MSSAVLLQTGAPVGLAAAAEVRRARPAGDSSDSGYEGGSARIKERQADWQRDDERGEDGTDEVGLGEDEDARLIPLQ